MDCHVAGWSPESPVTDLTISGSNTRAPPKQAATSYNILDSLSERFVDGDGKVGHAELEVGGSPFYLADTFPDMGVEAPIPGRSGASFCVYVPDVDASVAKAVARGATVLEPAKETFYGTRRSTIEDPYGHRWLVGTHIRNVSEREYQQAVDGFAQT